MYTQCAQMTFWGKFILQSCKIQVDFKLKKKNTKRKEKSNINWGGKWHTKYVELGKKARKFEKILKYFR